MRKKTGRPIAGILLLDKWLDATSNQALQRIKRLYQARKAGHTGSLDPLATGMLPICFGEATKFSQFLLNADKHYTVRCHLGVTTTTGDAEGEVVSQQDAPKLNATQWEAVLSAFRGSITQVPSMYSALKYHGKPLYVYARQGIEVPREARQVQIHSCTLKDFDATHASLEVTCSKGTYIRTLVEDIGKSLGCGAHVTALRRIAVSPYEGQAMHTLEALTEKAQDGDFAARDACLLPIESMLTHLPSATLTPAMRYFLSRGESVRLADTPMAPSQRVCLRDPNQSFCGVGQITEDGQRLAPVKLLKKPQPSLQAAYV